MNSKKTRSLPVFKTEKEEAEFWATHDTSEYFDTSRPVDLDLSSLKPSTQTISLRLPVHLLQSIRKLANQKDVPYQSLMKLLLAEKVDELTAK